MGYLVDRVHRELTDGEVARIVGAYHAWRGDAGAKAYYDEAGFCNVATQEMLVNQGSVLTPGRYVGSGYSEDDGEPLDELMKHLSVRLARQFDESAKLQVEIGEHLASLGYDR